MSRWMTIISGLVAIVIVCIATTKTGAHTITLTTTVRDFKSEHPDFEVFYGAVKGMVQQELGPDRKPVINPDNHPKIHSPESFAQWYNNVEGVNLSTSFPIVLDNNQEETGGVYTYTNSNFFPIDNELFGNETYSQEKGNLVFVRY